MCVDFVIWSCWSAWSVYFMGCANLGPLVFIWCSCMSTRVNRMLTSMMAFTFPCCTSSYFCITVHRATAYRYSPSILFNTSDSVQQKYILLNIFKGQILYPGGNTQSWQRGSHQRSTCYVSHRKVEIKTVVRV